LTLAAKREEKQSKNNNKIKSETKIANIFGNLFVLSAVLMS